MMIRGWFDSKTLMNKIIQYDTLASFLEDKYRYNPVYFNYSNNSLIEEKE
jgi:hypothetical protein